jgi:hypothetical protein
MKTGGHHQGLPKLAEGTFRVVWDGGRAFPLERALAEVDSHDRNENPTASGHRIRGRLQDLLLGQDEPRGGGRVLG